MVVNASGKEATIPPTDTEKKAGKQEEEDHLAEGFSISWDSSAVSDITHSG